MPVAPDYYLQQGLQDLDDIVLAIEEFPIPPMDETTQQFILGELTAIRDRAVALKIELDPSAPALVEVG